MHISVAALLGMTLLSPAFAFQKEKPAPAPPPPAFEMRRGPFGGPDGEKGRRMHKAGSWLRKYNNMPAEDQQRALENDEKFQQLPPERQQQLRERLRRFNELPADDRERMIDRLSHFEEMSPEQRERWKQFQERMAGMPPERRKTFRQTFRGLRKMAPEERQRVFASERFKQDFSADEKAFLESMLEAADSDARNEAPPDRPEPF